MSEEITFHFLLPKGYTFFFLFFLHPDPPNFLLTYQVKEASLSFKPNSFCLSPVLLPVFFSTLLDLLFPILPQLYFQPLPQSQFISIQTDPIFYPLKNKTKTSQLLISLGSYTLLPLVSGIFQKINYTHCSTYS